ncbi:hypothetical protein CYY_007236 [Polysphondylium violaceum]|uniref:Uncharacterized protein n=1 Tax=Polysphondylium violaceum TaxID=133409 RepID=A0A8J4V522_9MYCE|nr:hypothetical protein CYY_007236 [Polysphondylium violaceum]
MDIGLYRKIFQNKVLWQQIDFEEQYGKYTDIIDINFMLSNGLVGILKEKIKRNEPLANTIHQDLLFDIGKKDFDLFTTLFQLCKSNFASDFPLCPPYNRENALWKTNSVELLAYTFENGFGRPQTDKTMYITEKTDPQFVRYILENKYYTVTPMSFIEIHGSSNVRAFNKQVVQLFKEFMPQEKISSDDARKIIQYLLEHPMEGVFDVVKPLLPEEFTIEDLTFESILKKSNGFFFNWTLHCYLFEKDMYQGEINTLELAIKCLESKFEQSFTFIHQLFQKIQQSDLVGLEAYSAQLEWISKNVDSFKEKLGSGLASSTLSIDSMEWKLIWSEKWLLECIENAKESSKFFESIWDLLPGHFLVVMDKIVFCADTPIPEDADYEEVDETPNYSPIGKALVDICCRNADIHLLKSLYEKELESQFIRETIADYDDEQGKFYRKLFSFEHEKDMDLIHFLSENYVLDLFLVVTECVKSEKESLIAHYLSVFKDSLDEESKIVAMIFGMMKKNEAILKLLQEQESMNNKRILTSVFGYYLFTDYLHYIDQLVKSETEKDNENFYQNLIRVSKQHNNIASEKYFTSKLEQ